MFFLLFYFVKCFLKKFWTPEFWHPYQQNSIKIHPGMAWRNHERNRRYSFYLTCFPTFTIFSLLYQLLQVAIFQTRLKKSTLFDLITRFTYTQSIQKCLITVDATHSFLWLSMIVDSIRHFHIHNWQRSFQKVLVKSLELACALPMRETK